MTNRRKETQSCTFTTTLLQHNLKKSQPNCCGFMRKGRKVKKLLYYAQLIPNYARHRLQVH